MTNGLLSFFAYGKYVKGELYFNYWYTKGGTFSVKMVYKRVRGCTMGRSLLVKNFVEFPPEGEGGAVDFEFSWVQRLLWHNSPKL